MPDLHISKAMAATIPGRAKPIPASAPDRSGDAFAAVDRAETDIAQGKTCVSGAGARRAITKKYVFFWPKALQLLVQWMHLVY